MQRSIKNVVVLGSGVMGARIACHFAGVGVKVLLLDRLNPGTEESTKIKERNKLVDDSLLAAIKSNPSPLYAQKFAKNISTGNFTDDIAKISTADWIIDMGPEGGSGGGKVVVTGTPEEVASHKSSHTAKYLKPLLAAGKTSPKK